MFYFANALGRETSLSWRAGDDQVVVGVERDLMDEQVDHSSRMSGWVVSHGRWISGTVDRWIGTSCC